MKKILITGGHLTPALAVIDQIQRTLSQSKVVIIFAGRKYALDSEKTPSLEFKEINARKIKFVPIEAGRLTRIVSLESFFNLIKIPLGFGQALKVIKEEKPDIILSFGGYLALAITVIGFIYRVPVYTHEQTTSPGLANKIIGIFARKVFIAFEDTANHFNPQKTILTGNPVRESIFKITSKPFEINNDLPVVYITGGSLGSHSINDHVAEILPQLLSKYNVIHQIGDVKKYGDYERLLALKDKLVNYQGNYYPVKHFRDEEIGYVYSVSDLIIGRAGANTFFESIALKKPALFIPLPWAANQEQKKQADFFQKNQVGESFDQSEPSKNLFLMIDEMMTKINFYKSNFHKLSYLYHQNAAQIIIEEIFAKV